MLWLAQSVHFAVDRITVLCRRQMHIWGGNCYHEGDCGSPSTEQIA